MPDDVECERDEDWQDATDHGCRKEKILQCLISRCGKIPAVESARYDDDRENDCEKMNEKVFSRKALCEIRPEFIQ